MIKVANQGHSGQAEQKRCNLERRDGTVREDGSGEHLPESVGAHQGLGWPGEPDVNSIRDADASRFHQRFGSRSEQEIVGCDIHHFAERDQEEAEDRVLNSRCVKRLVHASVVSAELSDDVMVQGDNAGTAHANDNGEEAVDCNATPAGIQILIKVRLVLHARRYAEAANAAEHEGNSDQVKLADLLTEGEIENDDVEDA